MKTILRVDRDEIHYLRTTLESYDGMAVVRTIDPHEARIEVMISPGCEELMDELLDSLRNKEHLNIKKIQRDEAS